MTSSSATDARGHAGAVPDLFVRAGELLSAFLVAEGAMLSNRHGSNRASSVPTRTGPRSVLASGPTREFRQCNTRFAALVTSLVVVSFASVTWVAAVCSQELGRIYVAVTDEDGRPVTDLGTASKWCGGSGSPGTCSRGPTCATCTTGARRRRPARSTRSSSVKNETSCSWRGPGRTSTYGWSAGRCLRSQRPSAPEV